MTRIKLELTAVDDRAAVRHILKTLDMMEDSVRLNFDDCRPLSPGYGTSDLDGSCVATVTREDNGIERGMEVTP